MDQATAAQRLVPKARPRGLHNGQSFNDFESLLIYTRGLDGYSCNFTQNPALRKGMGDGILETIVRGFVGPSLPLDLQPGLISLLPRNAPWVC